MPISSRNPPRYQSNHMGRVFYLGPRLVDDVTGFQMYRNEAMRSDFGETINANGNGFDFDRAYQRGEVIPRTPRQNAKPDW